MPTSTGALFDPLISLAFAVHTTKGGYALLVGSGVSTGAGIPTGWGVAQDLVKRFAQLQGQDPGVDPDAWYRDEFGETPNYSRILESLAPTPAARRDILRPYFEPTEDDRESGLKIPSRAHRAIAALAAAGHVRVILTTNFDHLLEIALRDIGITPAVLGTPDAVSGSMPLHLEQVTIVKLNGDYLDTRIKNTLTELSDYEPPFDRLLDRIFEEYGLIVCGWSAVFDGALRRAIARCPSRRFMTYWATRGTPTSEAAELIALRKAQVISIDNADSFFEAISEKITALDDIAQPHPATTAVAIATIKRYLAVPEGVFSFVTS